MYHRNLLSTAHWIIHPTLGEQEGPTINLNNTIYGQQHWFLEQRRHTNMAVASNPYVAGLYHNNEYYKSEEQAPGLAHSPRIPHQRKILNRQSTSRTSPPHTEQRLE